MNVNVTLLDGSVITAGFDPAHEASVIGFYAKAFWTRVILGYRVQLSNGEVFSVGQVV
jgi:hypothetical protein